MDEGSHAIHMRRLLQIGQFYDPAGRLRLLQMTQKIIKLRNGKLLEWDMERNLALGFQFSRWLLRLLTGPTFLRGLSFHHCHTIYLPADLKLG